LSTLMTWVIWVLVSSMLLWDKAVINNVGEVGILRKMHRFGVPAWLVGKGTDGYGYG